MFFEKKLQDIDLNLLVIFEAIYTSRNISQAAVQLGMSQPTMSNALARLRNQLGDQLFVRLDRGVAPTVYSDNIIGPVRNALGMLRSGLQQAGSFDFRQTERVFRIACHGFTTSTLLPVILREIDAEAPGIRLEIMPPDWDSPFDGLLSGRADIAIDTFPKPHEEVGFDSLYATKGVAIVRKGHPLVDGILTPELFARLGHVVYSSGARRRTRFERALVSMGISRKAVCEVHTVAEVSHLVSKTDLIAIAPVAHALSVAEGLKLQVLELPFPAVGDMLISGWMRQREHDAGLTWLREAIRRAAAVLDAETSFALRNYGGTDVSKETPRESNLQAAR